MYSHLHLLGITTTVNQEIQQMCMTDLIYFTPVMLSGMANSVKASVAVVENLLHVVQCGATKPNN